ncbi:MAG: hypothetical protein HOQ03_06515 [Thermoleophilia bacterium]|nr:hypothetical protein [Thermoleophilia bacterium]
MKRILADLAGRAVAALVWTIVVITVAILAAIVGLCLVVRHVWRVLLAWPKPLVSDADLEALLHSPEDMDAELARLIAEEKARQRRDGGSVRAWLAGCMAVCGVMICALVVFVMAALNIGGLGS